MEPVVLKHKRTTLERAEKFISSEFFTDVNLYGRKYTRKWPLRVLKHFKAPGRITYDEAIKGTYTDTSVGSSFGPTWSTHWFYLEAEVPDTVQIKGVDTEVYLLWNSNSEAMVWQNGQPLQGLSGEKDRISFPLSKAVPVERNRYILYVEMACNGLFGAGSNGLINPPDPNKMFTLSEAEVGVVDKLVYDLMTDIEIIHDMAKHLPEESERAYEALYTVNRMINTIDFENRSTLRRAHHEAEAFFMRNNGAGQHTLYAMGHAHIDTAWLWPYAETIRKCARSWVTTIRLMEDHPNFIFTCSQAQQYEWLKEHYPGLYKEIKKFVKKGQFIPVGGTWVEMDGNIPSGESFIRQFLLGQRFFQKEFQMKCSEFWLPDTFGYSAQLPQIMCHCGITRFLTQKLSWSLINKFPHHTFWWEGIDGSQVLSHFPPGDSYHMECKVKEHHTFWWEGIDGSQVLSHFPPGDNYCMKCKVEEMLYSLKNYKDKGRSPRSVYLFGHGDGGQGPTEDMLKVLSRVKDVDGLPKVKMSTPNEFFSEVEHHDVSNLCRWRGELYLELHNGTYTTHAKVKKRNRLCEFLLHNVEFLSTVASFSNKQYKYPLQELSRLWKLLLLNQFHDVLPGSSIGLVYHDAHKYHKDVIKSCKALTSEALSGLTGSPGETVPVVVNTLGWQRTEVVQIQGTDQSSPVQKKTKVDDDSKLTQIDSFGNTLGLVSVPSYGYTTDLGPPEEMITPATVTHHPTLDGFFVLDNGILYAVVDHVGRITELYGNGSSRNFISSEDHYYGNQLVIFDDVPLFWDAWDVMDYHLETRKPLEDPIQHAIIFDEGPLRASLQLSVKISDKSYVKQVISLDAGCPYLKFDTEVHWHESHKFLKAEFATSIHSTSATYEIQFGHLQRSNHNNTSWDWAQFEVCGHKWADISEFGYGVAVLNNSQYGYSTRDGVMRLSLLRSPKAPDEHADMGVHSFSYAVMPHRGSFQVAGVIAAAYNLNSPLQMHTMNLPEGSESSISYFKVDNPQVILETVKKHEDHDNALVLRLYESFGGQTRATITCALPFTNVYRCNGLEEACSDPDDDEVDIEFEGSNIRVFMKPFQILSLTLIL